MITAEENDNMRVFNIVLANGKKQITEMDSARQEQQHNELRKAGWVLNQHWHFHTLKGRVSLFVFSHHTEQRGLDSVDSARRLACKLVGAPELPPHEAATG